MAANRFRGGLSAVTCALVRAVVRQFSRGITLQSGSAVYNLELAAPFVVLSDADAARAMFGFFGASGWRFCWRCANVISHKVDTQVPGFVDTTCGDTTKFREALDSEIFETLDDFLSRPHSKAEREKFEQTCGLHIVEGGVLLDDICRQYLPPSCSTFDSMHLYTAHGVTNWEIAKAFFAVKEEVSTFTLNWLQETTAACHWQAPQVGRIVCTPSAMKQLWDQKYWDIEVGFKGTSQQTEKVLVLLHFFLSEFVLPLGVCEDTFLCLDALVRVQKEIRRLWFLPRQIQGDMVKTLVALGERHQLLFNQTYGLDSCRPKHHWRHHLAASAIRAGRVPNCAPQEKKHQIYKRGKLADKNIYALNNSQEFQRAMMLGILNSTVYDTQKFGMDGIALTGKTERAPLSLLAKLQDPEARSAPGLRIFDNHLHAGDVLFVGDTHGGIIQRCLATATSFWVELETLQQVEICKWGSRWKRVNSKSLWQVSIQADFTLPSFWRVEKDTFTCIH